ncbi:hypothetical protein CSC70_08865 [Pseudoxanthomonas kalamensis DSM 18571]|nr:hypothetical protein CSC70_08865 [Pseudoxanthomonas kalamensis DSM 18571]
MPLEGCATLGDGQQIVRGSGNGKRIYVRDGEDHYQLTFRNGCSAAVLASKISISTDGQANKLCSEATKVKADRQTCRVSEVTRISPEEFDRQKKRARH